MTASPGLARLKAPVPALLAGLGLVVLFYAAQPRGAGLEQSPAGHSCKRTFSITPPDTRVEIAEILEKMGAKTGAELGVQKGLFAESTLKRWRSCTKYQLVDLWAQQVNYEEASNVDNDTQEARFQETKARVANFPVVFHRMYTSEAAKLIPDGSLDYVYVDARHDYCGCMQDLELYWPKLRPGGLLAGHDYLYASEAAAMGGGNWSLCADGTVHPGAVRGAVEDFVRGKGLDVVATLKDRWPSFMVVKPPC